MDSKTKMKLSSAASKLKKFIAGSALIFGMSAGNAVHAEGLQNKKEKTETVAKKKTDYSHIKLNTIDDIYKLFDMSLNIIFAALILEEVPMDHAYNDGGKLKENLNTFGLGTIYAPANINNYNKKDTKWFSVLKNPKTFWNRKYSAEDMLKLVIGWGKYRIYTQDSKGEFQDGRKTVLEKMFAKLKGAELTPNEFAAVFCAVYNNERNINNICPIIAENYNNPIKCANALMFWWNGDKIRYNSGTKDRCEFESLVYLNADDFCENMLLLYTEPKERTGFSCIYTPEVVGQTLTKSNYKDFSKNALGYYGANFYGKNHTRTGDLCNQVQKYFKNTLNEKQNGRFYNIVAETCLNSKYYDKCILFCQKTLKTTDKTEYAMACFYAGRAYEARKNYQSALRNYNQAVIYADKYGVAGVDEVSAQKHIYADAARRVQDKCQLLAQNTNNR